MMTLATKMLLQGPQLKDREETRFIPSLLRVRIGPLSHRGKGKAVQPLIQNRDDPLWRTSKDQRVILVLLREKPYTLSDLNRCLNKPWGVLAQFINLSPREVN